LKFWGNDLLLNSNSPTKEGPMLYELQRILLATPSLPK
jgi:hypothetical protein